MPHETSDFVSGNDQVFPPQTMQPTFITLDREVLIRALTRAEDAAEFGAELLAKHDDVFGRSLQRHRNQAEYLEKRIFQAKGLQVELRSALGWLQRETR